jgi:hypothetical protein
MRVASALVSLCSFTTLARADVQPTAALRVGGAYAVVRDDYVQEGEPAGVGPELEVEVGARFHPRWSAAVLAATGQFTKKLGFENTAMSGVDNVDTTYRHLMVGGGVTWRPIDRAFVRGAIGRAFVTEIDAFDGASNETSFRSTLVGIAVGGIVYEHDQLSVQLSIGFWLNVDPEYEHALLVHVPLAVGVAWN